MNFDFSISARGSQNNTDTSSVRSYLVQIVRSSLLVLPKDFLMAELFMQVKITFDDKLKVVELIIAALEQWPLSNCSLLF